MPAVNMVNTSTYNDGMQHANKRNGPVTIDVSLVRESYTDRH